MGIAVAIVVGAVLGALTSMLTFLGLARRYRARERIETGETLLHALTGTQEREEAVLKETRSVLEAQLQALESTQERGGRLEDLLERAETALNNGREIWGKLEQQQQQVAKAEEQLEVETKALEELRTGLEAQRQERAGWSQEQAREAWLKDLNAQWAEDEAELLERERLRLEAERSERARELLITSIQRQALKHGLESCVDSIELPNEAMKMRLIGREGRNARAFQRATGVDLIIDDTPGLVVLSSFQPLRRQLARMTLERLFEGGVIHPARIDDAVEAARVKLDKTFLERGQWAAEQANIHDLPESLLSILGRLEYHRCYGQNTLLHSLEVANLAATLAAELGLDAALARRCGLLHDLGRVLEDSPEVSHEEAGARCLRQAKESETVVQVVASHHQLELDNAYHSIVQVADKISAQRQGARSEAVDKFVQRLEKIEQCALSKSGVEAAYAFNAGRELRVFVRDKEVSARAAPKLAKEIAKDIDELGPHPGPVDVTIVRERHFVERVG